MIYPISWEFAWPYLLGALASGYLIGSIPFGLLLTRLAGLGDVRAIGSGNIGATNVLRTGRKGLAALTVALDVGKGTIAVLVALRFGPDMGVVAAAGAVLGPNSLERGRKMGLDAAEYLAQHRSSEFFGRLGDLVITGPTRTNVNDFRAIFIEGGAS